METRACGRSGLRLSVLGIGCWSFGGGDYWGPQDQLDADAVVIRALEMGITYFDTAEGYNDGRSEESLGKALRGRRERAIIGTKVGPEHAAPETLRRHCEASLRRLGTDTIDLYMLHWPIPGPAMADAFDLLTVLRKEGKIRWIGVSNFGVRQLTEALATGADIVADQLVYNLLSRMIEPEILPLCRERGVGVVGYMPLMQGLLTGKYLTAEDVPPLRARTRQFSGDRSLSRHGEPGAEAETFAAIGGIARLAEREGLSMSTLALAWAAARPGITTVLLGVRNVAQLEEGIRGIGTPLSPEVVAELDALTEPVLRKLGPNADLFQGGPAGGRIW